MSKDISFSKRVADALALLGIVIILVCCALVLLSVAGRVLLSAPIVGDFEMVEILIAFGIFSFIPALSLYRGNIRVTIATEKLSKQTRGMLDSFGMIVFAMVYLALAGYGVLGAYEAMQYNLQSQILGFPLWPVMAYGCVCFLISAFLSLPSPSSIIPSKQLGRS